MTVSLSPSVRVFSSPFFLLVSLESVLHCDVSRKFQGCFNKVSRVFQGNLKVISRMFQGCFEGVLRVFKGSFNGVFMKFQGRLRKGTWILHESYKEK